MARGPWAQGPTLTRDSIRFARVGIRFQKQGPNGIGKAKTRSVIKWPEGPGPNVDP